MRHSCLNRFTPPATQPAAPPTTRRAASLAAHLVLSLSWLLGCLPLVTAPAATAALFEVARLRDLDQCPAAGRAFRTAFRQHLRPASAVGFGWAALGGLLLADLVIVADLAPPGGGVWRVALLALLLLYLLSSVSLFPVLVSYQARPDRLVRTGVLVTLRFPGRAGGGLALVAVAGAAGWLLPVTLALSPSLVATAVYRLYRAGFELLGAGAGGATPAPASGPAVPATS